MARHGLMCEVGYEIEDTVVRLLQVTRGGGVRTRGDRREGGKGVLVKKLRQVEGPKGRTLTANFHAPLPPDPAGGS